LRCAQLSDELLIHLGGREFLSHQVLDHGVEADLEPLAKHRVGAIRRPSGGVAMPEIKLRLKKDLDGWTSAAFASMPPYI
jgi:hypothetical protein